MASGGNRWLLTLAMTTAYNRQKSLLQIDAPPLFDGERQGPTQPCATGRLAANPYFEKTTSILIPGCQKSYQPRAAYTDSGLYEVLLTKSRPRPLEFEHCGSGRGGRFFVLGERIGQVGRRVSRTGEQGGSKMVIHEGHEETPRVVVHWRSRHCKTARRDASGLPLCHFERSEKASRQGARFLLAAARRNDIAGTQYDIAGTQ